MEDHIQATIDELAGRIEELTELRDKLESFFPPEEAAARKPNDKAPTKVKRPYHRKAKVERTAGPAVLTAELKRGGPNADEQALIAVARKMPEPIMMATLNVASGKDGKFCANKINKWAALGWLKKIARGEYQRTKEFGIY